MCSSPFQEWLSLTKLGAFFGRLLASSISIMKYLHRNLQFFNLLDACLQNFLLEVHVVSLMLSTVFVTFLLISADFLKFVNVGISWNTNDNTLQEAFSKYGEVIEGLSNLKLYVIFDYRSPLSCLYKVYKFSFRILAVKAGLLQVCFLMITFVCTLMHVFVIMEMVFAHNKECLGRV